MPKAGKNAKTSDVPTGNMQLSNLQLSGDLAALVNSKIKEFETNQQEESEKNQKAQKSKARAAAKTKTKEMKQLLSDQEVTDADRVGKLWEMLEAEHKESLGLHDEAIKRKDQIADVERAQEVSQVELNRTLAVKSKMESLCRQLQTQTKALVEDRRKLTDDERVRRQALADEFQNKIGDVKSTMEQQANERTRLARENEDLRSRFKQFFEQYDNREKELIEQQKVREVEVHKLETKLREQAELYRVQATREATAQRENDELVNADSTLRGQLQTYSGKFTNFQDALSKSDKVLGQYKRQRNKMQRRLEVLEKENSELRTKNEKRMNSVLKERNTALKDKADMQERCKELQSERQRLLDDVQRFKENS